MTLEWESAVRSGSVEELERLFQSGCDINARDRHGQTALMIAAAGGIAPVVTWLIQHGAELNHTAKYGLSALMLAVIRGHIDVVFAITAAGPDLTLLGTGAPGFAGKTALDLALARGDAEMIAILRSATNAG